MSGLRSILESILPAGIFRALSSAYHFLWAFGSACWYGFPGDAITVIAVTGTKGKSSVTEMLAATFEKAGKRVAASSTVRFKIADSVRPNRYKMTLMGRGFVQKFLRDAIDARCDVAIIEITSEAALQYRHLFLSLNALVFTNLQKEHLERHGGMENYFAAKMRIGTALVESKKRPRVVVANTDDKYGKRFLALPVEKQIAYSLTDAEEVATNAHGAHFTLAGTEFSLSQPGVWSVMNALAAVKTAESFGVPLETSAEALQELTTIPGRAERLEEGQSFMAVVDYAHTPDSLQALYDAFPGKKICVLGNTGGGRDTWKRPLMGQIADTECAEVILTDEDPYDEDPKAIVDAMAAGMKRAPRIIRDRREAIQTAFTLASAGDTVLISGKGTDPYIMRAKGAKVPWSDAEVAREELRKLLQ